MSKIFGDIKSQLQGVLKIKDVNSDNFVFKLFYKATFALLIGAAGLVAATSLIGDPINCDEKGKVFEDHCWIHGANRTGMKKLEDQKHFGCVLRTSDCDENGANCEQTESGTTVFYQWITFVLAIHAALLRFPYMIWKAQEDGYMKSFYADGQGKSIENKTKKGDKTLKDLANKEALFFTKVHNKMYEYYFTFVFCEFLNVIMLVIVFCTTDKFLGGNFKHYGTEVLHEIRNSGTKDWEDGLGDKEGMFNVMCNAFPTVTSCTLYTIGSGGKGQGNNGMCILSQNIINQKIYLVLWFWYVFMLSVGVIQLLVEGFVIAIPALRNMLLLWNVKGLENEKVVRVFLDNSCNVGDWFVLYQLSKNTDKVFFSQLLPVIVEECHKKTQGTKELYPSSQLEKSPPHDQELINMGEIPPKY